MSGGACGRGGHGLGGPTRRLLTPLSLRFIGSGIRHCFTRNLVPHLPHFFSSHLALVGTEAAACLFVCLTAERFGRRAILLLCTVLTGISSLLLLALTQCKTLTDPRDAAPGRGKGGRCRIWPLMCFPPSQTCWSSLS